MQAPGLVDNTEEHRYEYYVDGALAAVEDYTREADVISFTHTEALPGFSGSGAARELVRGILDEATTRGLQVLPYCGYVAAFIGKHADEYVRLVPVDRRAEFGLPTD